MSRYQMFPATEPSTGIAGTVIRDTETGRDYGFSGDLSPSLLKTAVDGLRDGTIPFAPEEAPLTPTGPVVDIPEEPTA